MRRFLAIVFLLALAAAVQYRALTMTEEKSGRRREKRGQAALPVEVHVLERGVVEDIIEVTGEIEAWQSTRVTPRIGGFLSTVHLRVGDVVSAGKTRIASLDDSELVLEEQRAWAALRVSEATFKEKEAAHAEAVRQLERERSLFADKVSSREALDAAQFKTKSAAAALQLAQAQVDRSQAELGLARIRRRHARVVAPIDGVVAERLLDGGVQVTAATPIVTIVEIERVRVSGKITEGDYWRLLPYYQQKKPIEARVNVASGDLAFSGTVYALAPVFDASTRTATIEVAIPNSDQDLRPGMFARVSLVLRRETDALLVPIVALCERDEQQGVFVVEDGIAKWQVPSFAIQTRTVRQVKGGLTEGQQLITTGSHLVTDGSKVTIVSEERQ